MQKLTITLIGSPSTIFYFLIQFHIVRKSILAFMHKLFIAVRFIAIHRNIAEYIVFFLTHKILASF